MSNPLERLRHHVTGAIERGESLAIVEIPARPDTFGYFARKAQREADIRAAAPYIVGNGETGRFASFEALESHLQGLGLCVDPARLSNGGFAVRDCFTACRCGTVWGAQS